MLKVSSIFVAQSNTRSNNSHVDVLIQVYSKLPLDSISQHSVFYTYCCRKIRSKRRDLKKIRSIEEFVTHGVSLFRGSTVLSFSFLITGI